MNIITENLDTWTSAIKAKSSAGRGTSKKQEFYGIKKLRELILELAVRGLLVPQDPNDEPASELLKKITKERVQLITDGKIKKSKQLQKITAEEITCTPPLGWEWCRLGALFNIVYGKGLPNSKLTEDGYAVFGANGIIGKYTQYLYEDPQLLVSCRGAYSGKPNISPEFCFVTSNSLVLQNTWRHLSLKYFYYALSIAKKEKIVTGSAQPQVTTTNLEPFLVQLPPLAEQHRIVAKVDELMALCDQLELRQEDSLRTHQTLVKTLLGALTDAADSDRFSDAWQMIASNFDTLFITESSIDQLKQTILQLAVMGKLVPQLEKTEDSRLDFPKWKGSSNGIGDDSLPNNWMNIFLGKIGEWKGGGTPSKGNATYWKGLIPWVCPKDMKRPLISDSILQITKIALEETSVKSIPPNSLLMVVRGMILARDFPVAISGTVVTVNQDMKAVIPTYEKSVPYLALALRAFCPKVLALVERSSHGTCKLQTKTIQSFPIPIPPLAEQGRIVAKVDELMALCDQLKANLAAAQTTQLQLADTLVENAVSKGS